MGRNHSQRLALALLALAAGCASEQPTPEGAPPKRAARPGGARPVPAAKKTTGRVLRASELLPIPLDKVLWYRASFPGSDPKVPPRQVAMFGVRDPEVGRYLETVGLGESRLRLIRRQKQVWLVPSASGLSSPLKATVIYEEGEAIRREPLVTALGRVRGLRVDRQEDTLNGRFWFKRDQGLVQHEMLSKGAPVFRLELLAVLPRGRPRKGYDRSKPERMWSSLQEAIRRLDVASLPEFFTHRLLGRLGGSGWQATSRMALALRRSPQIQADRIRRLIPDLLDVRLKLTGAWTLHKGQARAPAELRARLGRKVQVGPAVVELVQGADKTWRWDGFHRRGEPSRDKK